MATKTGRKPAPRKKNTTKKKTTRRTTTQDRIDAKVRDEVTLLVTLAITVLLFLCNFHVIGSLGDRVSYFMFGVFGWLAYVAPLLLFFAIVFGTINIGNHVATIKLCSGVLLFIILDIIAALIGGIDQVGTTVSSFYTYSAEHSRGGGVVGAFFATAMESLLGAIGTVSICLVFMIICLVVITEKSFIGSVTKGSKRLYENAREDVERRKVLNEQRRLEREDKLMEEREQAMLLSREKRAKREAAARGELTDMPEKRRMDRKVSGVAMDTRLPKADSEQEITVAPEEVTTSTETVSDPLSGIRISGVGFNEPTEEITPVKTPTRQHKISTVTEKEQENPMRELPKESSREKDDFADLSDKIVMETEESMKKQTPSTMEKIKLTPQDLEISDDMKQVAKPVKPYKMPPFTLLKKGEYKNVDSTRELKETALKLQQTLKTFGVNVTVTDISKGPAVTRYELQPEVGVKVSKIVNLSDDIKLNLAATDIRIEAPIPGKAAVGIEVPNKENSAVALRDLLESREFGEFGSKLSFAVGKDISGKTVVTDIAKMPHLLIAGSTGSGKSVCINTLIMSLLYKAKPDEVKMILVDPKVVELSVYNGIPHLMVPVVTDPKKAAAALNWGVAEMTERYKKFADFNVRDLASYNKKVEEMVTNNGEELPEKLPQIVIIVDELADLMMVAPGEVEESICRLAQLARAAGIHLVIATQRPSVDVITGLIKANMPSRIAFAVSSGVDSRTILDMNGAEKLLGKGDMLFYPQGYAKPARVQGAFVSDKEVSDVVEFIKSQCDGTETYSSEIADKIANMESTSVGGVSGGDASLRDEYFADAGRFIIEKDKASIGMLQRMFKIGFNRAARIMDQLADLGVVGEEEGTKPRKVLMSMEQFEQLLEEI